MSLWVGAGIVWVTRRGGPAPQRAGGWCLVALFVLLSSLKAYSFLKKELSAGALVDGAAFARRIVPPGNLVIVVDNGDPTFLYHLDQKGWHASVEMLTPDWIDERHREGAAYLISSTGRFEPPGAGGIREMLQRRYANRSTRREILVFDLGSPRVP